MTAPIIDRLNARIAAEPTIDHLDTLFVDLQDARDTIVTQVEQNTSLKDMLASGVPPSQSAPPHAPAEISTSADISEVIALLTDAKERISVNATSTAGDYIDQALRLLS